MAYQNEDNALAGLLPLLTNEGQSENPLAQALAVLLNAAMLHEREQHIGAAPYERNEERNGHANGYKERTLSTRLGQIAVAVPQVRNSAETFRPQSLEAALLSEKALKFALAEMYVQGVCAGRMCRASVRAVYLRFLRRFAVPACPRPASVAPQRNSTVFLAHGGSGL